jgi:hypothetical protein
MPALDVAASLTLFLDLGDVFTKGLAVGAARRERVRFPSIVAHTLLSGGPELKSLVFDPAVQLPRLSDFDAERYPRTRSFHGSDAFVRQVRDRPPAQGARFAGGIAAIYGADRRLLGMHPTEANIDALVRKAYLLLAPGDRCRAEVVFVIDLGTKADALMRYSAHLPPEVSIEVHNYRQKKPRKLRIAVRARFVDAITCARAALPSDAAVERVGRTLLVDIGYLRTKFAIVSRDGCEHQEQVSGLGVSDCVYRILRDGQEQGLVEDEFAVIRALEACRPERFEVAGRRFDVRKAFESAGHALEEELVRIGRRIVLEHYGRSGEMCKAVALIGGGAAIVGQNVGERLKREFGFTTWAGASDGTFLLEGAARIGSSDRSD